MIASIRRRVVSMMVDRAVGVRMLAGRVLGLRSPAVRAFDASLLVVGVEPDLRGAIRLLQSALGISLYAMVTDEPLPPPSRGADA